MFWSLPYVVVRRLLELTALLVRGERSKELEILVLRHELSALRRSVKRPALQPHDRVLLAVLEPTPAPAKVAGILRHLGRRFCVGIDGSSPATRPIPMGVPVGWRCRQSCASSS